MREIKFRAWDAQHGFWVFLFLDKYGFKMDVTYPAREISGWLESTGLKDKNGREIYEGDILRSHAGIVGPVEWDELDAYFVWMHPQMVNIHMTEGEVIGNIYETPELLDGR